MRTRIPAPARLSPSRRGRRTITAVAVFAATLVATSTVVSVGSADAAPSTPGLDYQAPAYSLGDLTGDGIITTDDVSLLVAALGRTDSDPAWSDVSAADANADGVIDLTDVASLSQRVLYDDGDFDIYEASIVDMQKALQAGSVTSVELVQGYLDRIDAYDSKLNSIISVNQSALAEAAADDRTRATSGPSSMLFGIPIIVKDNYDTEELPTTAGCFCLKDNQTSTDSTMVAKLRAAGAIVLAKANMDEFATANASTTSSVTPDSNHTSVTDAKYATKNVYNQTMVSGGSSGGSAVSVSANLAAIGFGTDTGGSIRVPSSWAGLVGIRPTVGLTSRAGIVPLALSQDTGGPMARSVSDAAIALDVVAGSDSADPATAAADSHIPTTYTSYLDANGLNGARIGYITDLRSSNYAIQRLTDNAITAMKAAGATVVNVTLPNYSTVINYSSGSTNEFKHDLNIYLTKYSASTVPYKTLADIVASPPSVMVNTYGTKNNVTDAQYATWMTTHGTQQQAVRDSIDQVMAANNLDAIIYPTTSNVAPNGPGNNNRISAYSGYPAITMPMGLASAALDSSSADGTALGLEFLGQPYTEGELIKLTYSFEQATHDRVAPPAFPALSK